jgi:predicted ABC-type ATPase
VGGLLRWTRDSIGYTAVLPKTKSFNLTRRWDPKEHPRDRRGRFIKTGARVRITGGGTGTVVAQSGPAAVTVERDSDGKRRNYPAGHLTVIGAAPGTPARTSGELSDDEYRNYVTNVRARLDKAIADGLATDRTHTADGDGQTWTPERAAQHKKIVDSFAAKYADVPTDGEAILSGGLGGSGKTTVLTKHAGVDTRKYATINPDDIKEVMAERGMIPDVEGLSPMEASALIHEESSHIANLLAARLYADRKNVIWDITMSRRGSVERRVDELHANGYTRIRGVFVDIPVEKSVERATARHRRGMEKRRRGEGPGGRFVPPEIIRANASGRSSSANLDVFEALRPQWDTWEIWDNSIDGQAPRKKASGAADREETASPAA